MAGLVTYYVPFFIHLASRKVYVAGATPHPDQRWMMQIARHVTMEEGGFLTPGLFLDFVVGRARRGELRVAEAQRIVQAVSTRYPQGFVPHTLALLGRLTS